MKRLQIDVPNKLNAESYTVMYKKMDDLDWNVVATTPIMPYNISGLNPNEPIYLKVKKNCKSTPCTPCGVPSQKWID